MVSLRIQGKGTNFIMKDAVHIQYVQLKSTRYPYISKARSSILKSTPIIIFLIYNETID